MKRPYLDQLEAKFTTWQWWHTAWENNQQIVSVDTGIYSNPKAETYKE